MFKDRLRAARCDSELRNHLMGHKCKEPPYGFGWSLEMKLETFGADCVPGAGAGVAPLTDDRFP
jgi:hypothetical protein